MKRQWVGKDLWNLLNLPNAELRAVYPNDSWEGLRRTRNKYRTKARKVKQMEQEPQAQPNPRLDKLAELFERSGINLDDVEQVKRVNIWQGFIKNADGEIETVDLASASYIPRNDENSIDRFISQADPIKIVPSRHKPVKREHKLIVVFGDNQIDYRLIEDRLEPIHDERVMDVTRMICRELQPETIVNIGDTLDLAALSRFPADSNHFQHSMKPAINRVHRMYAELRADNPATKIVEVDSNHNERLKKFLLKNFPQAFDLIQAGSNGEYPVLSYPFLVNLQAVGVDWIGGYGAAEYIYGSEYDKPPIIFKHGELVVKNGSTMAREATLNPETHIVRGHSHRMESIYRTNRMGRYLGYIMVGASCDTTGRVPSYHSAVNEKGEVVKTQENWQQSILLIEDYGGDYVFNHIPIVDGIARYNGKEYHGKHETNEGTIK